MVERREPCRRDLGFNRIKIINFKADVVEGQALGKFSRVTTVFWRAVKRNILAVVADME